jgi:hypothetical protein
MTLPRDRRGTCYTPRLRPRAMEKADMNTREIAEAMKILAREMMALTTRVNALEIRRSMPKNSIANLDEFAETVASTTGGRA